MSTGQIHKLRFENLSFNFEGQDPLFQSVDFDFPLNQLVWVKAEHGAGRSTLLQILAALQVPVRGSYWINDQNVGEMSFEEFLPYRLKMGYGFDTGGLIHNRTVFENLVLPLHYHKLISPEAATERVDLLLKRFDLWKYRDQRPSFISGGTRKLACLLRALIQHPEMLLLDDPTVGLEESTALQFFDLLQELRQNHGLRHVFVSSFDDKFMSGQQHTEVFIEGSLLHRLPENFDKKLVAA